MSFVALGVAVVGGVTKLVMSAQDRKRRREEQTKANAELAKRRARMDALEITNPYENLENTYEDLTINQQQAQFQKQMFQQQQANQLQGLRGAAGASGVAGLAQAMANQGQIAAQKAGMTIGQQEQSLQLRAAQGEAARQQMVAQGEVQRQTGQREAAGDQLELALGRKGAADQARSAAETQRMQAMSGIVGGVGAGLAGGISGPNTGQGAFWANLQEGTMWDKTPNY